jgi:hypothetical protein
MVPAPGESFHSDSIDLPWAESWSGDPRIQLKVLMVDVEGGRYAVRMRFRAGLQAVPHKHTGEVDYADSPPNVAGSYLFEPPGTTHTLKIADDAGEWTEVLFVLYGAMLHLDESGAVIGVTDAEAVLAEYRQRLIDQRMPVPASLPIGGRMAYRPLGRQYPQE